METHIFSHNITYFIENINWWGILIIIAVIGYAIACYIKIYKDYKDRKEKGEYELFYNEHKNIIEEINKLRNDSFYNIRQYVTLSKLCENNQHLEIRVFPIDFGQDVLIIGGDDFNYNWFSSFTSSRINDDIIKRYGYKIVYSSKDNTLLNLYRGF